MLSKKMFAILIAFAFIALPIGLSLDSDDSDASDLSFDSASITIGSFKENSAGTISVTFANTTTTAKVLDSVYVTNFENGQKLTEINNVTVPARADENTPGKVTVNLTFQISSPGTHYVVITALPDTGFPTYDGSTANDSGVLTIEVGTSIWANSSTYIVIVVVVIIIVIAVWLVMRNKKKDKKESTGVFTAMDAQKRAARERKYEEAEEEAILEAAPEDLMENEPEVMPPHTTKASTEKKEYTAKQPTTEKKEYSGKQTSSKKKTQQSAKRKSDPNSRKSSKRR